MRASLLSTQHQAEHLIETGPIAETVPRRETGPYLIERALIQVTLGFNSSWSDSGNCGPWTPSKGKGDTDHNGYPAFDYYYGRLQETFADWSKSGQIYFEPGSDPKFSLGEGLPTRTAVTKSDRKSPIYFNSDLINVDSFQLSDAIFFWLHEISHKTNDRKWDVDWRDKVAQYLTACHITRSKSLRLQAKEFKVESGDTPQSASHGFALYSIGKIALLKDFYRIDKSGNEPASNHFEYPALFLRQGASVWPLQDQIYQKIHDLLLIYEPGKYYAYPQMIKLYSHSVLPISSSSFDLNMQFKIVNSQFWRLNARARYEFVTPDQLVLRSVKFERDYPVVPNFEISLERNQDFTIETPPAEYHGSFVIVAKEFPIYLAFRKNGRPTLIPIDRIDCKVRPAKEVGPSENPAHFCQKMILSTTKLKDACGKYGALEKILMPMMKPSRIYRPIQSDYFDEGNSDPYAAFPVDSLRNQLSALKCVR